MVEPMQNTRRTEMEKKIRLQLEMTESKIAELDALAELTGLGTRTALLNNALSMFKWAIGHRAEGKIIAAIESDEDNYIELGMPALDAVAEKKSDARKRVTV